MSKFKQAIYWLRNGKRVRRPSWNEKSYWIMGKDESIEWLDGTKANIHLHQIEATDWELFKEKETLSDKIFNANGNNRYYGNYACEKDIKDSISKLKDCYKFGFSEPEWNHKLKEIFGEKLL